MGSDAPEGTRSPIKPCDDGLEIPEVGRWSKQKYHFLSRYLHLFSTGMKNKWPRRHYIDLFSGAGFIRVRDTNEILAGSPVICANLLDPFSGMHLCEADPVRFDALGARLNRNPPASKVSLHHGDANALIREITRQIPRGALCLTFADPFGLHLDFETISEIAGIRSDLIILLADNMDAVRNWATYYYDNPDSNLDRFMGEPGWRKELLSAPTNRLAETIRDRYRERLRSLGYAHFGSVRINNDSGRDIYSLVFASRDRKGLEFWNKAASVEPTGQRRLFPD